MPNKKVLANKAKKIMCSMSNPLINNIWGVFAGHANKKENTFQKKEC